MKSFDKSFGWAPTRLIPLVALLFLLPARGQSQSQTDAQSGSDGAGGTSVAVANLPNAPSQEITVFQTGIPDAFKRHLLGEVSLGVSAQRGFLGTSLEDVSNPVDYDADGSVAITYDLPLRRAEYVFQASAGGRVYANYSSHNTIADDAGFSQSMHLGQRTMWYFSDRFSITPDYGTSLIGETLNQQASVNDPVGAFNNPANQVMLQTTQTPLSPLNGEATLRYLQFSNAASNSLSHKLTARTSISFGAGYSMSRFEQGALYGSDGYSGSLSLSHGFAQGFSVGLSASGTLLNLRGFYQKSWTESVGGSVSKQLGRRSVVSISGGPARITTEGQSETLLPQVLATLLERQALQMVGRSQVLSWEGSGQFSSTVHDVHIGVGYSRGVTGTGGIAGAALSQGLTVSMGTAFHQRTDVSLSASVSRSELLGLVNPLELDQLVVSGSLSRAVSRAMDMGLFASWVKMVRGTGGFPLISQEQAGVRFTLHFPRVMSE